MGEAGQAVARDFKIDPTEFKALQFSVNTMQKEIDYVKKVYSS